MNGVAQPERATQNYVVALCAGEDRGRPDHRDGQHSPGERGSFEPLDSPTGRSFIEAYSYLYVFRCINRYKFL